MQNNQKLNEAGYITVIIPAYKAEKYLQESVESALSQPETGEVILVEDASPDRTLEICQALDRQYSKVRLLRHDDEKNHGAGASRNLGINNARYNFISFLDADDFYLPGRFDSANKLLKESPDNDGVYEAIGTYFQNKESEEKWWSMRGKEGFCLKGEQVLTTIKESIPPDKLFKLFTTQNIGWFHGNGLVVRKSIFQRTGLFNEELELSQDIDMWTRMMAIGTLRHGKLDIPVAMRRVHGYNRILVSKEKVDYYNLLSWKSLLDWGYKNHIDTSKLELILRKYIRIYIRLNRRGNLGRTISKLYLPVYILKEYPWAIKSHEFRKYILNLPLDLFITSAKYTLKKINIFTEK